MKATMPIGRLARATGCKVQTIRYYEQVGLLPEPARSVGDQRRYTRQHLQRLAFIRHARELGFPLPAIRELLRLSDRQETSCEAVDRIAREQLAAVERRIAMLGELREELGRMVHDCRGGRVADCRIIEVLSDASHGHCLHDGHDTAAAGLPPR